MSAKVRYIVNSITLYRTVMAPVLLWLVWQRELTWFTWLLGVSFFTDAIDGYLARKYKVVSVAGARLDSIGDDLTILISIIAMLAFKQSFVREERGMLLILVGLFIVQLGLSLAKYQKPTSFHTLMAKLAAVLQGLFFLLLFFLPRPLYILFWTMSVVTALELVEEIIMVVVLREWKADVRGIWWLMRSPRRHVREL